MPEAWREQWKATIDQSAEAARLLWITGGAGQALVYEAKRREAYSAVAQAAAGLPPLAEDFPLLAAEIGITAGTLLQVAQAVDALAQGWVLVAAQIEALRLPAKRAIDQAETEVEARAAAQAAMSAWPRPAG